MVRGPTGAVVEVVGAVIVTVMVEVTVIPTGMMTAVGYVVDGAVIVVV